MSRVAVYRTRASRCGARALCECAVLVVVSIAAVLAAGCAGSGLAAPDDSGKAVFDIDWSPDGTAIAFTASGRVDDRVGLFVMAPDGKQLRRLTPRWLRAAQPRWSPDGRRIVFSTGYGDFADDPTRELYVVNSDGTGLRRLTKNAVDDTEPEWAPNGSRIVFVRAHPRRPYSVKGNHELFVMRADGSDVRRLTDTLADERSPTWSPDGQRIGYLRYGQSVHVFDLMHGTATRIVRLPYSLEWYLNWAPRGDALAFGSSGAMLVNAKKQTTRRLTSDAGVLYSEPLWSRDARYLVFQLGGDIYSPKTIWLVDVRSGRRRSLGFGWGEMAWSPDGRTIGFAAGSDVYLIDRRTGKRTLVQTALEKLEAGPRRPQ